MNPLTPTQQELNVRFAKARGWHMEMRPHPFDPNQDEKNYVAYWWHIDGRGQFGGHPNYFAPENFHLVRAAVVELKAGHQVLFFSYLQEMLGIFDDAGVHFAISKAFLSPIDKAITAYLKVKEVN